MSSLLYADIFGIFCIKYMLMMEPIAYISGGHGGAEDKQYAVTMEFHKEIDPQVPAFCKHIFMLYPSHIVSCRHTTRTSWTVVFLSLQKSHYALFATAHTNGYCKERRWTILAPPSERYKKGYPSPLVAHSFKTQWMLWCHLDTKLHLLKRGWRHILHSLYRSTG